MLDIVGFARWLSRNKTEATVKSYVFTLNKFQGFLKGRCPTTSFVDNFLTQLTLNGNSPSSVSRHFYAIKKYFKYLGRESELKRVQKPKIIRKEADFLPKEDVEKLINACFTHQDRAMFMLLFSAALRIGELIRLNRDDIDFKNNRVRIRSLKQKSGEVEYAHLPVGKPTINALKEYIKQRSDNNSALFISGGGRRIHPDTVRYRLKRICKIAGLRPIKVHTLRHSRAVDIVKRGCALPYLQRFMRHKNINTSMQYVHLLAEDLEKEIPVDFE
jgi:integrase/recombinase XerD